MSVIAEVDRGLHQGEENKLPGNFDLLVAQEFELHPASIGLVRRWTDEVFTQIVANTTKKEVSDILSDRVVAEIAKTNNDEVSGLAAKVGYLRKDDVLLVISEIATNSVAHSDEPSEVANERYPVSINVPPQVELPLDNLGELEKALLGNQDLDNLIHEQMGPTKKFVVALGVDIVHQEVTVFSGDGNPSKMKGLSRSSPAEKAKAEHGRGGQIVYRFADGEGVEDGSGIDPLRRVTKSPLKSAAYAKFRPRINRL